MDKCVICGGEIVLRCKCMRADTECENGHKYHRGDDGQIHLGMSNHGNDKCCDYPQIVSQ